MSLPTIHKPQTVGELRAALAELPDNMPLHHVRTGGWLCAPRLFEGKASKATPKKVVYRGGVPALFIE